MARNFCPGCGAAEGAYHAFRCDKENCPFCGGRVISCGCFYKQLNIEEPTWLTRALQAVKNASNEDERTRIYAEVLARSETPEERRLEWRWRKLLKEKGRIPYLQEFYHCERCGLLMPDLFMVLNDEWQKYVVPELQNTVLCRDCYEDLKLIFPEGWQHAKRFRDHKAGKWGK